MSKQEYKVVKIPRVDRGFDIPASFPKMPMLYLELIENKDKIKQHLVNKSYTEEDYSRNYPDEETYNHQDVQEEYPDDIQDRDSYQEDTYVEKPGNYMDFKKKQFSNEYSEEDLEDIEEDIFQGDVDKDTELKNMLNDSSRVSHNNKYSRSRNTEHTPSNKIETKYPSQETGNPQPNIPPTLNELKNRGVYTRKNIPVNLAYTEDDSEDLKRELLFKFDILRKTYPTADIPEFTIHSNYEMMKSTYENSLRRLSIDSTVESYKTYLIGGFMVCEYLMGNFLGFDMQGFTQQQIISIKSYEKLLIELGEKSYVPTGSRWPVEVRLLFLVLMNAGLFIISKMIMSKTGSNIMNMVNNMNASKLPSDGGMKRPKRKMRGPTVDINSL